MGLIWGFVMTKADIPVRPEDLRFTKLGREFLQEFLHRPQHLLLVHGLALGPVLLGVVIFKARVKRQRLRWPATERHRPSLRPRRRGRSGTGAAYPPSRANRAMSQGRIRYVPDRRPLGDFLR